MKKILFFALSVLCVADCCGRQAAKKVPPKIPAVAAVEKRVTQEVVIDHDTGDIILEKSAHERCIPSSMTKIMTLYLVFEAIENGTLRLDNEALVSEVAKSKEGSRSFFEAGSSVKIENLIRSVAVHSGNDGCTVLAEKIAGDEDAFAAMMNSKAKEFGLRNTNFMNSTGLPHENHYSSVADIAIIAQRIIKDFPQFYHYFSEKSFAANGITQPNRNTLLGNSLNVDGLKTGKTQSGGCGIVISAKNNGKRLIVVVNGFSTEKMRATAANKLLAMGMQEYVLVKVAEKDKPIANTPVKFGKKDTVSLYVDNDIIAFVPRKYRENFRVELSVRDAIEAPIMVHEKLGTLVYKYGNHISEVYDIHSREYIEKVGFFKRLLIGTISFFTSNLRSNIGAAGTNSNAQKAN